jgi:hypothetical protein
MTLDHLYPFTVVALLVAVFGEASIGKLVARETPAWFAEKFAPTWLGRLPAPLLWWSIAIAELTVLGLAVAAIASGGFTTVNAPLLDAALLMAMVVFSGLCFGLRVAEDYVGGAQAFGYAALTGLIFASMRVVA